MDKTLQLTLKINADTSGLNKSLAGVGAGVKRVKVPVDLEASGEGLSKNIRVRLDGAGDDFGRAAASHISKAKVQADFGGFVADQLANRIAKATGDAVEEAVRKGSKGDLLGAIGGLISKAVSIPVQAVTGTAKAALGAIANGATATARTAFQGVVFGATQRTSAELGAGISAGLQKAFGATIGSPELIGRKLIEKLGQTISQAAGKAADAAGVDLPKVGRAVKQTLGEQEVLIDSRAKSAEDRQVKTQRKESAQVELNRERQDAFRTQTAAIESYARITQSIESQSRELIKENADTVRELQAKLSELAAEASQDAAEPIDAELVKAFQLEIRKAKASLEEIQQTRIEAATELETALASATADAEKTDIKEQAKAYQVALRKELQGGFSTLLNDLVAPAVELEQLQQDAKAKLDETFAGSREARANFAVVEGGDAYRASLEAKAKVLDTQQLEIANRIQQQQKTLGKGLGIEAKLAAKIEAAPDTEKDELLALQEEAQRNIKALATEINDLKSARAEITDEIAALGEQARAIPQGPNKVVSSILEELGVKDLPPESVPQVQLATNATLSPSAKADYVPEANLIRVRKEIFDQIQEAKSIAEISTQDDRLTIREEVAHGLQFDFGSAEGNRAFKDRTPVNQVSQPTAEEIQAKAPELQGYVRTGKSKDAQVELEAKVAVDRIEEKTQAIKKQAQDLAELEGRFGYAGSTVQAALERVVKPDRIRLETLKPVAQELGDEAIERIKALEELLNQLEKHTRQALQQVAEAKTGKAPQIDVAKQKEILEEKVKKIFQFSELIDSAEVQLKESATGQKISPQEPVTEEPAGALAVAKEKISDLGGIVQRVSGVLSPIGSVAEGTVHALALVGKAGLALADKLGFAASSLIPGGALAYEPVKAAVKFAAPAVAAGALATQVPGATELIGAISASIAAILAPATSGLSASVGHAVSSEIAGALPSLFNALSRAVAESGLPGSQITAAAVDKLGGGLIHLLEPMIGGVVNAADSTILSVGHAVNEFLGEVGGLLLAGKGLQEGVKLATSEEARAGALKGVETIGSGLGQVVGGVQDGIQDAADAIDRTKRAVQQNLEGIKGAAERVAQGDIRAVGDAVEETQAAVSNLTRGVQDVAKASTGAVQNVVEGTAKVVGVFGDLRSVKLPDGLNLVDLAQDQLLKIQQQLRQKLETVLSAEAKGLPVIGGSSTVKRDLEIVGQVLEAKYEVVIDHAADQVRHQIEAAPLDLPIKLAPLPELDPVVVQAKPQAQAQAIGQTVSTTARQAGQEEEPSPIELAQQKLNTPAPLDLQPKKRVDAKELQALVQAVIEEVAITDNEVKDEYSAFSAAVNSAKEATKKRKVEGRAQHVAEAKKLGNELALKISNLQEEIGQSIDLLSKTGVDVSPGNVIGDDLRRVKSALGQKAKLIPERLASIPEIPGPKDEPGSEFQSLQSLDISLTGVEDVLRDGATSLSKALKRLVEVVFEVQGDTLKQSLALAATSPRAQDLAVNAVGLAASSSVADHGQVAQLAADLTGALVARQAIGKTKGADAPKTLGNDLFGDITGFVTGNVANALTGVPGSGAAAASLVVPQLQKLRDQIQAKYGQPIDIEVPVDLQFEGLQSINPEVAKAYQQVSKIDELLAGLRQLEAEGKLVTPTVGERIRGFLDSITGAFAKADTGEIQSAIARVKTELARGGDAVNAQLSEEIQQIEQEFEKLQREADQALGRIESTLYEFDRVEKKINDRAIDASAKAEALTGAPIASPVPPTVETYEQLVDAKNAPNQARRVELESQQQQQISEIDRLIAEEQVRLAEVRRLATEEQRLKIGAIDQQIDANLAQLNAAKAKAQAALDKTKDPNELLANATAERRSPQEETLARIAQAAQQSKPNPALDSIAQAVAQAKSNSNGALDAIAKAVEQGRQDREQVNQRLAAVAAGVGQLPSNTGDSFTPLIAPQQPFSSEEKLKLQRQEASAQQASAQQAQQVAEEAIKSVDFAQVMNGLEAIAVATQQQQQAVDTVDAQLERAAAEGRAKAERLTQHLAQLSQKAPEVSPSRPAESVDERLSRAAQEGNQRENSTTERLARANQLGSSQSDSLTEGLAAAARDGAQQREAVFGQLEKAAQEAKQAINTVDNQLEQAAAAGKAKADALSQRLARLGQKQPEALPSQPAESVNDRLSRAADEGGRKVDPVAARLAKAAQDGAQQRDAVSGQLEQAALEANQIAQKEQKSFGTLISANTEIIQAAEDAAKQSQQASNEALHGLLAVQDAKAAEEQVNAKLRELNAQRDPIYDAPQPSLESDRLAELRKQREQTSRPIQDFQAEDLNQFVVPRQTFNPTDEERGVVARQRLLRDASERDINAQVNSILKKGTPTPSLEENQINADIAIASFDKNAAKFDAVAEQIEGGSTRTQKAFRTVGEEVTSFRQKLNDAGGVHGVLGKIGQSLSSVAEKAGLPVGVIGKLGNIIKGVGIAALAYIGVTQLGDAIVQLGQKAFESYSKVELLQKRLKFVGGGDSALQEDLAFIRKESERLKIPVDQLTESFTSLRIATKGTTLEGGKAKEFATALGTLSRVYGLTAEQAQSVQYQLGQTIRLGRAQGDELRSISDAGINITGALAESLGKSGAEIADLLEKGQISADQTVNALIRLGEQAKSGLPDALTAASVSVDSLKKEFVDVALTVGEKTAPLVVAGVSAIGAGIKLLEQTGQKLSPVFDAIGNGVGLILDIASPIVGVIGAIAGAIGGDLLDGIAIPFQAINAGLIEIREGFTVIAGVAGQALSAIGEQAKGLVDAIPYLGDIIKYANPAKIAIRLLGAAIGTFLVGQMIQLGVTVGSIVIPALISMAGTMTATVIPAIGAAITASLAFLATPLGPYIVAIGVAAALAAPHIGELANELSGLGDAQVKANDRATKFNNDYQKSLGQLSKGIPLTVEELKNLKDGFQQNVKEGKDTAETAAKLSANLDRMQASAEAAAQIQAKLTKAMADSTKAIKLQSQAIDAGYSTRLAGLNESLANQQITRERFDQEELAAQGEKSGKYLALYQTQGDNLRSALAEANARLAAPLPDATRTEVKKQVETLQDQIYEIEQKGGEQRIASAQNRVKVTEGIEKDRAKRAENEIKALENQLGAGTTAQVEVEHEISAVKQSETKRRIAEIDKQLKTEVMVGGKLSEIAKNLYSERAVLESELSKIVSEEATKRYDILLKEMEKSRDRLTNAISEAETEANIELQNAQNAGLLKQADVEAKKTNLTRTRLQKDLALELAAVETLQSLPSPTDPEKAEEHQKRIREGKLKTAQIVQQISENEYKRQESIRNLAAKALDEQVKGAENAATAIEQIGKLASNALERQNKILEAQKSLRASIVSLHDEEFKILIETETNERDKADLQEKAAKFRLDSLRQSQALEERILEIQLAQEKVQNRVATIKAQAALAKAEAEQAKVNANPESTDADKQAAALGVQASQIELGATVESGRLQEGLGDYKRQQFKVNNQKDLLGAKFEYAKAIVDPLDRRDAIERIQAEAARGLRERNQDLLPIGNRRVSPPPDYTQLDSASQQLGLTPKGVNLGRFTPPTPVDLHSGINLQSLQVGDIGAQLKELRLLTQNGVASNLVTLVQQNQALAGQLMGLANRPQVVQNIQNKTTKRTEPGFAGLPL